MANHVVTVPELSLSEAVKVAERLEAGTITLNDSNLVLGAFLKLSELSSKILPAMKKISASTESIVDSIGSSLSAGDKFIIDSLKGSIEFTKQTLTKVDYNMTEINKISGVKIVRTFDHPEFADCYGKETEGKRLNKGIEAHINNGTLESSVRITTTTDEMVVGSFSADAECNE